MLLSADDRELIQEAIRLGGAKQSVLADSIGIAASALSDCLRQKGQRPISNEKLDMLLEELVKILRSRAEEAAGRQRMKLNDIAEEVSDARDRLVTATLEGVVPGTVLPGDMMSRLRHDGERHLVKSLFSTGGVSVRLYPPKMGASSIAAKMEAQAARDNWRVVRLRPPQASSEPPASIVQSLILQITGSEHFAQRVRESDGLFTSAKHALENWAAGVGSPQDSAGASGRNRTLAIMDRLEEWVQIARGQTAGELSFLKGFYEFLRHCDRLPMAKRLSLLVLSHRIPTTLGRASAAGMISDFVRQSNQLPIALLTRSETVDLAERLSLSTSDQNIDRIAEETLGNIFLAHVWLYLLERKIDPTVISIFIRSALESKIHDLEIASQATIADEIERFGSAITAGFALYLSLIASTPTGPAEIASSIEFLRKLKDDEYDDTAFQEALHLRPIQWLIENGVVAADCRVGALRILLGSLIEAEPR